MMKIIALFFLMLFGMLYAARMSCDSCGQECERSCGTRRFRACCFNYLRKKRGPESVEFWTNAGEIQPQTRKQAFIEYLPDDVVSNILGNNLRVPDEILENQATV